MKIFLDTANIEEIEIFNKYGFIDGITTNPALIAKEGKDFKVVINQICDIIDGPISAEVVSKDVNGMIEEAKLISNIHENIIVKLPSIENGFEALKTISKNGIKTNFTVVYTTNQAL